MTFRAEFDHHDDLLHAAIDEFSDRGYEAASINRILTRSGVSKGQLYHHFTNKEGLYVALIEWMIDEKARWFEARPFTLSDDFFETLRHQVHATVEFAADHPEASRMSGSLLSERGRPIFLRVTERFAFDPDGAIGSLIAHYYAQGQFRSDLHLAFVQRAALLALNHAPELLDLTRPSDLDDQLDHLISFLRSGLARP